MSRRVSSPKEKKITSHDGLSLYYEVLGEGEKVLVFVHGLGGDIAAWDEERVFFQQLGYKTIAFDLRAHGYSDHPQEKSGFALDEFARDIHAIIEAENIHDFVLVGHCFGGMVAFTFADLFPNRAKGLVLIDTSYRAPYISKTSLFYSFIINLLPVAIRISPRSHVPHHADYTVKGFEHDFEPFGLWGVIKHNSLRTFLTVTEVVFRLEAFEILKKITSPTLIIVGTDDTLYPVDMSQKIHQAIKNSEISYIDRGNHPVVLNRPLEVSLSMLPFLKKLL